MTIFMIGASCIGELLEQTGKKVSVKLQHTQPSVLCEATVGYIVASQVNNSQRRLESQNTDYAMKDLYDVSLAVFLLHCA